MTRRRPSSADHIEAENHLVEEALDLLDAAQPISAWPTHIASALASAIRDDTDNEAENAKARRLSDHLFAGAPATAMSRYAGGSARRAERLRADLADLTAYGSGIHLLAAG